MVLRMPMEMGIFLPVSLDGNGRVTYRRTHRMVSLPVSVHSKPAWMGALRMPAR